MKNTKKHRIGYRSIYAVLALILLLTVAIVWAVLSGGTELSERVHTTLLKQSEVTYVILAICAMLPVLILFACIEEKKSGKVLADVEEKAGLTENVLGRRNRNRRKLAGKRRFATLSRIDRREKNREPVPFDQVDSLAVFCDSFRRYCATELKLYYSIDDIRKFVSGLAVSKLMIMQGMSGTGKTSLAVAFGKFVQNPSVVVPVQPMWKECTDLMGYYNEFTKKYNETVLLDAMYEAGYRGDMYVAVLDEMNIARVEYYFAEFLSLMELPRPEERKMQIISDVQGGDPLMLKKGQLQLPVNMWFVGTANNDDSTFAVSDKVYDRAMIMNLDRKTEPFECPPAKPVHIDAESFERLVSEAESKYAVSPENVKKIALLDAFLSEKFHITFGNRIKKQISEYIPVYIACGGEESDAVDDIVVKKILRKLEAQNPVYVRNTVPELESELDKLFGEEGMPLCRAYLHKLERSV